MYQNNYGPAMQQPFFNGYNGYSYGPRPAPKCTQPVTPELSKMLIQQNDELDIRISNTDKVRNWCTHKEPPTGRLALVENQDGTVTCRVCGETFHIVEDPEKEIQAISDKAVDIVQTIKTIYVDAPEEFIKNFSQVISMIKKLPDLMKRANKNFGLYEVFTGSVMPNNPGYNSFQAANGILNGFNVFQPQQMPMGMGMNMGMGYQPQPQPQAFFGQQPPMGQPMMGQQPQQAPAGYPQQQWAQPPVMGQPTVPQVDQFGNVIPGQPMMPNGPTTMGGAPMAPGYNPMVNTQAVPGAMTAPVPTGPAQTAAPATDGGYPTQEPVQTKQMTV